MTAASAITPTRMPAAQSCRWLWRPGAGLFLDGLKDQIGDMGAAGFDFRLALKVTTQDH
jgi:hypothetical protein